MDRLISHLLALVTFAYPVAVLASQDITITALDRRSYYQNPNELCFPAAWTYVVTVFSVNHFAHAATIPYPPGTSTWAV